ncbi:MAG: hypothetical protein ABL963_03580 [Longimicrobiales bacterium]
MISKRMLGVALALTLVSAGCARESDATASMRAQLDAMQATMAQMHGMMMSMHGAGGGMMMDSMPGMPGMAGMTGMSGMPCTPGMAGMPATGAEPAAVTPPSTAPND